ncbi:MAG: transketolase [Patescibacteria group bacterium]|nr:transketolase [Patescibacteria group bacterium]
MLTEKRLIELEKIANRIREDIIEMLLAAKSGHSAGPLGMADVFTALYFEIAKITPETRGAAERDRVILSNAHICPVLYATLANRGYFPREELKTLRKLGTRLQGHSNSHFRPDVPIETSGGPLGQGLSQAVGMAIAARANAKLNEVRSTENEVRPVYHTWCLMSDGELDEGQTWEAITLAGKLNLRELTAFVDRNNIQIDGFTEDIMPLEPLADKFKAFNWSVVEVDGHNIQELIAAADKARAIAENPTVIICHTIPGKGVDFMENRFEWHGKPPNVDEARVALMELRTLGGQITSEHE